MNVSIDTENYIFPIFVYENELSYKTSLKLNYLTESKVFIKNITKYLESIVSLNIDNILLFGVPQNRNVFGSESFSKNGIIQKCIKSIRENFGTRINIIADVCVCQYNKSGHCGVCSKFFHKSKRIHNNLVDTYIDNDKTLKILGMISLSVCEAGTDFIAPSSMMDGQVFYLKHLLKKNTFENVKIMSYSAKHNSCLYSPFRNNNYFKSDMLDKSGYQNSFYNKNEALREMLLDVVEGSDWLMVKPSFWYMDIIASIKEIVKKPVVVQNVSGEYAMIKAATEKIWLDEQDLYILFLKSLKRAGADKIITYFLLDLLKKIEIC